MHTENPVALPKKQPVVLSCDGVWVSTPQMMQRYREALVLEQIVDSLRPDIDAFQLYHVVEPGVVHNEAPDRNILWVGEPDDRNSPRIEALRATLKAAGIDSPATTDIRYEIWHKLMANLTGSTVCLVTGQAVKVQATPIVNRLSRRAHAEALAVAAAHGVMLDDHPDKRYGPTRVYSSHRPSILQDYDLGRPMEIESIVRAPLAFARSAGVETPTLDAIESICVSLAEAKGLYSP